MNDSVVIQVQGLCKSYGPIQALRGVDLEVQRGEDSASSAPTAQARQQPSVACWT